MVRKPDPPSRRIAVEAMASSVRQEIVSELAGRTATVKDLSESLGRSRQALHFHVSVLAKAGVVEVAGERGEGRERERLYRLARHSIEVHVRPGSANDRADAARAVKSMLRLTQREAVRTLLEEKLGPAPGGVPALALRAKGRLAEADLIRLQKLLDQMRQIFRRARGKNRESRMLAMTIVLAPARESGKRKKKGATP